MKRRRLIAAVWITGSTIPLLFVTVFVFGCCVLPFHQIAHKLMPICDMAAAMMRGDHGGGHDHDAAPPPAPEQQKPVKRMATEVPQSFRLAPVAGAARAAAPQATTAYRSFITLGAVRCDQDVGLHVFVETFLI